MLPKAAFVFVALLVTIGVYASPVEAQEVPTTHWDCRPDWDNGTWITNLLTTHNVVTHGFCSVDFGPLERNPAGSNRAAIEVPSNRTLDLTDSAVVLRPGQTPFTDTRVADIIRERTANPSNITIRGGTVDGLASVQTGHGYDGIALVGCQDCLVEGVTVRNIRGVDTGGGATESFALTYNNCRGNCVVRNSRVTASGANIAETSSGFATNSAFGVTFENADADSIEGRGFAIWNSNTVTIRSGSMSNGTVAHGVGVEDSQNVRLEGVWSVNGGSGGLQLRNSSGTRALDVVLAWNASHSLGLRETSPDICSDNVVTGSSYVTPPAEHVKVFDRNVCDTDHSGLTKA